MPIADLNLLRVFDVMLEESSVTRAGARLGLTQSAVSHALNRLRHALDDDLFVRGPHGMSPTVRAIEMGPAVHAALHQLQTAIARPDFDAATSERRFALVAGAYACAVLAPTIAADLAAAAPHAELAITAAGTDIAEQLDGRRVDFVIGGVVTAPERFSHETLFTERLVWVVRADSPVCRGEATLEALVSAPHVAIGRRPPVVETRSESSLIMHASWEDFGAFESALEQQGLTRKIGVTVPDTYSALSVVAGSDMVALAPRRLALTAARWARLRLIEPPYESPPADVNLMYLRDRLAEPSVAWMHDLLLAAARKV